MLQSHSASPSQSPLPSPSESQESQSSSHCQSRSASIAFSYEQTLNELDSLQKEFQRMEANRRQKVNSLKLKRNQQLQTEYKIKVKDEHSKHVRERRASLDNTKTREKLNKSAKNQRKRESRLKLLETVGSNALRFGHLFSAQQKENQKRRENVLQRKQELQRQKDQKRKEEYLQKQKLRDKKIAKVMNNRKRGRFRPKSASNSFLLFDTKYDNKENKENKSQSLSHSFSSFDEYFDIDSESDLSFLFDQKSKQKQKEMMRSKSARSLRSSRASSLNVVSDDFVMRKTNPVFKYNKVNPNSNKNKKKKYYGFMKPTLSAYLITNHPSNLFAAC